MCKRSESNTSRRACLGRVIAIAAGAAAVVGLIVLLCRYLARRSENGACPCRALVSRLLHIEDPNAADYAD